MRLASCLLLLALSASLFVQSPASAQTAIPDLVLIQPQNEVLTLAATQFEAHAALEAQPTVPLTVRFAITLADETLHAFEDTTPPYCAFGDSGTCLPMPAHLALQLAGGPATLVVAAQAAGGLATTLEQPFSLRDPSVAIAVAPPRLWLPMVFSTGAVVDVVQAQATPTESLIVRWEEPATEGATVARAATAFRLYAADPRVGAQNGDGLRRVEVELRDGDTRLHRRIEWKPSYCAFGGDRPCLPMSDWLADRLVPGTAYTIRARAIARNGQVSPWQTRTFQLGANDTPPPPPAGDGQVIRPPIIGMQEDNLINPLRGFYRWSGQEYVPQPGPAPEAYARFTWRDLEPTRGRYDFSKLDQAIESADREGRRYAFRVRSLVSTKGSSVPDYLMEAMGRGWWHDKSGDGKRDSYVPDWNDTDFLERAEALVQALGKRYNGDPRIAFVDIGMYGNWGEWHMHAFPYPSRSGAQAMTTANRQRIIDGYLAAFPDTQLIMMSDNEDSLRYALERSPTVGWRRDSFGWDVFANIEDKTSAWALAEERWKTAPVIVEFANPNHMTDPESYALGLDQAARYHVSLVGNGNMHRWNDLSGAARRDLLAMGKLAGYRLSIRELRLPTNAGPGEAISIGALWQNHGSAPPYEPWQVRYELRDAGGAVRWQGTSTLNLGTVLPGADGTPVSDRFTLPRDLVPGSYILSVRVTDPAGQRPPMQLAMVDDEGGSYTLATLTIR